MKQHQQDLIYYTEYPEGTCNENNIDEVGRSLQLCSFDKDGIEVVLGVKLYPHSWENVKQISS